MASQAVALDGPDNLAEPLDRAEAVQRVYDAIEVQRDVFVHNDVAKTGQAFEFPDHVLRKACVPREQANRFGVVLEPVAAPGGQLSGDIDHELRHHQQ